MQSLVLSSFPIDYPLLWALLCTISSPLISCNPVSSPFPLRCFHFLSDPHFLLHCSFSLHMTSFRSSIHDDAVGGQSDSNCQPNHRDPSPRDPSPYPVQRYIGRYRIVLMVSLSLYGSKMIRWRSATFVSGLCATLPLAPGLGGDCIGVWHGATDSLFRFQDIGGPSVKWFEGVGYERLIGDTLDHFPDSASPGQPRDPVQFLAFSFHYDRISSECNWFYWAPDVDFALHMCYHAWGFLERLTT